MKKIVVGVDSSPASSSALEWAAALAGATGADVVALNAFRNTGSEMNPHAHDAMVEERRAQVTALANTASRLATITARIVEGDPREVLGAVVADESADLVVVGRTGSGGGPGFLHLGSVAEHCAHHCTIPLAVIPQGWTTAPQRIVVGVDGSPPSLAAVAWVRELATRLGASVTAVEVEEPFLEWTPESSPQNWRRDAERRIGEWTAGLLDAGIDVRAIGQRDLHPADGLIGATSANRGDLLVVGTRGVGGFLGLRAGGVALKVLHRASLPVVLVPRA